MKHQTLIFADDGTGPYETEAACLEYETEQYGIRRIQNLANDLFPTTDVDNGRTRPGNNAVCIALTHLLTEGYPGLSLAVNLPDESNPFEED